MTDILLKLAQQAAENPSFLAHQVENQARRENVSWEKLAKMLDVAPEQLAKMALCRQPREAFFSQDTAQIAGYAGINRVVLLHFLDCARQGLPIKKKTPRRIEPAREPRESKFMLRSRAWATGLAAVLFLILAAFVMAQPSGTDATLVVSAGQAVVNQAGGAVFAGAPETAVSTGEVVAVRQGDTIRLGETATAQLRLKDGSTVDLSAGTILIVSELVANDQSFRARFSLLTGQTFNQVVRLLKPGDAFEIKTPSSTASVRGTMFTVEVISDEVTHFAVTEGVVQVTMGDQMVDVPVGNQVTAVVGQMLQVLPLGATSAPTNTPEPRREPTAPPPDVEPAVPVVADHHQPEMDDPGNGPPEAVPGTPPAELPNKSKGKPPLGGENPPGLTDGDDPDRTDAGDDTTTDGETESDTDKMLICHYPAGDDTKGQELEIAKDALQAHLNHGDTEGHCPDPDEPDASSSEEAPGNSGNSNAGGNSDGNNAGGNSGGNQGGGNSGGNQGGGNSGGNKGGD